MPVWPIPRTRAYCCPSRAVVRERADPKIAILFDCDGVIVETEELHRLAYNKSFVDSALQIQGQQVTASIPGTPACIHRTPHWKRAASAEALNSGRAAKL